MLTLNERERRAYMAGHPELADLFDQLAQAQARADALGDLLADAVLTMENIRDGYPDFAPSDAEKWLRDHHDAIYKLLE